MLRKRAAGPRVEASHDQVDDRIRESARAYSAVQAHRRAAQRAEGDRRRHAASDADEPATARRCRRRQNHRRAARGARRHGERPPGGVHGADRNSGRAALPQPAEAAGEIALSRRAHHRRDNRTQRRDLLARLAAGDINLVVGTHALVQGTVNFRSLGLAIIDEQHRFGVVQRATLRAKGLMPDVLVMTATPIPRTLALTVYGDLDVSVIRDMPPGRRAILTTVKPESRREDVYELVQDAARRGAAGIRRVSTDRRVGESRPQSRDGDGRHAGAGRLSGISRGAAAREDEAGRKGPRHAGICGAARFTCSCRRP